MLDFCERLEKGMNADEGEIGGGNGRGEGVWWHVGALGALQRARLSSTTPNSLAARTYYTFCVAERRYTARCYSVMHTITVKVLHNIFTVTGWSAYGGTALHDPVSCNTIPPLSALDRWLLALQQT